jgi:hypothetical protein
LTGGATVTTNASGQAIKALTANSTAGAYSVTATVSGASKAATFSLTNKVATATRFAISPTTAPTAGVAFSVKVTALDAFGNLITNYSGTVHFTSTSTALKLPANVKLTNGVATVANFVTNKSGSLTITATDITKSTLKGTSATIAVHAGAAASIIITSGNGQSATVGTKFTTALTVTVKDKFGNPVSGAVVTFNAPGSGAGAAFTGGLTVTTNSSGQASKIVTANTAAGTYAVTASVKVSSTASKSASFSLTNVAGSATQFAVSEPAITLANGNVAVPAGTAFSVVVTALDQFGNVATNYHGIVTFSSTDPSATLPATSALTNGSAQFDGVVLNALGDTTISATDTVNHTLTGSSVSILVNKGSGRQS